MRTTTPTSNRGTPDESRDNEYPPSASPARSRRPPTGVPAAWRQSYVAIWIATLSFATLVVLAGEPFTRPIRNLLGLRLTPQHNPRPHLECILALAAHNTPLFAWPLLLGPAGAHRHQLTTRAADVLVLACVSINTVLVGAALGAYGMALLPYEINVPVEWAALALGAGSWLVQRQRTLSTYERLVWLALIVLLVLCAATLETVGVPHR